MYTLDICVNESSDTTNKTDTANIDVMILIWVQDQIWQSCNLNQIIESTTNF